MGIVSSNLFDFGVDMFESLLMIGVKVFRSKLVATRGEDVILGIDDFLTFPKVESSRGSIGTDTCLFLIGILEAELEFLV